MSRGQVVILEDEDWVARLLEAGLVEHGYQVTTSAEAIEGVQRVTEVEPDCIICDVTLPDFDGYWVAQQVRAGGVRVAATPLLFLSAFDDEQSTSRGLKGGADALVSKPFRMGEVIAQVDALVDMARRLRSARATLSQHPKPSVEALSGDLEKMSLVTVLTILEMERRSGDLKLVHESTVATIALHSGYAADGTLDGQSLGLVDVLRAILSWKKGVFSFRVGPDVPAPDRRRTIAGMLVEAVLPQAPKGRPSIGPQG